MRKENAHILIQRLQEKNEPIVLDIGCGKVKRGTIGIDYIDGPQVDLVMDINKGIHLPDNSVDKIIMYHTLEHVTNPPFVISECARILKDGGILDLKVPHHTNPRAFEIHHKTYWNLFSFEPLLKIGDKSNEQKPPLYSYGNKSPIFSFSFPREVFC